ncbi:MAG: flagellar filament capping protein FliD [Chitinivibrionia bacterium]|nr:flagellar filament capping protein FliD [Chitinivibrionia bacterium]
MAGITMTGTSGIDVNNLITQLTALRQQDVTRIESKKTGVNKQIDAYTKLGSYLSEFQTKAAAINKIDGFNVFKSSASSDAISISTTGAAQSGSYSIEVMQLAQKEKLSSGAGKVTSVDQSLSSMGISPGKFSINGVEIEVAANDTINDLRLKINTASITDGDGKVTKPGVTATVVRAGDGDFRLVLTSDESGAGGAEFKDLDGGSVLQDLGFITDADGTKNSANVLMQGQDAIFSIDNMTMTSSTNTINDRVAGVNLELKKVTDAPVEVSVTRDDDAITKKVEDLINMYNAVLKFANEQTSYTREEDKDPVKGALFGDSTVKTITANLKAIFTGSVEINGERVSLSQIGLKTNKDTGMFELDKDKFKEALTNDFDKIVGLFVTRGNSDNAQIQYGRSTTDTQQGTYEVREHSYTVDKEVADLDGDGNEQLDGDGNVIMKTVTETVNTFQIRQTKDANGNSVSGDWITGERSGNIVTFGEGAAKGMSITAPVGSGNATITLSKGFAGAIEDKIKQMTDFENGVVATKKESLNTRIKNINSEIERTQRRVDAYNLRLVNQFAAMEKTMMMLNSQQTAMGAQLSWWNN